MENVYFVPRYMYYLILKNNIEIFHQEFLTLWLHPSFDRQVARTRGYWFTSQYTTEQLGTIGN